MWTGYSVVVPPRGVLENRRGHYPETLKGENDDWRDHQRVWYNALVKDSSKYILLDIPDEIPLTRAMREVPELASMVPATEGNEVEVPLTPRNERQE